MCGGQRREQLGPFSGQEERSAGRVGAQEGGERCGDVEEVAGGVSEHGDVLGRG